MDRVAGEGELEGDIYTQKTDGASGGNFNNISNMSCLWTSFLVGNWAQEILASGASRAARGGEKFREKLSRFSYRSIRQTLGKTLHLRTSVVQLLKIRFSSNGFHSVISRNVGYYYSAERATVSTRPRFLTLLWHFFDTFLIEGRSLSDRLKLAHVN